MLKTTLENLNNLEEPNVSGINKKEVIIHIFLFKYAVTTKKCLEHLL